MKGFNSEKSRAISRFEDHIIAHKGSSTIPDLPPTKYTSTMPLIDISREEIKAILDSLDVSKATGSDDIPGRVLKQHSDIFADILYLLFTRIYNEGNIPRILKLANVVPIFKKGDQKNPNNYRPVSLIPIISKVLEIIMKKTL